MTQSPPPSRCRRSALIRSRPLMRFPFWDFPKTSAELVKIQTEIKAWCLSTNVGKNSPGAAKLILRNGLAWFGGAQLLQLEQHRYGALQLSIEMDFIAGQAFEAIGFDSFAECLRTDQRPVLEFSPTIFIPG